MYRLLLWLVLSSFTTVTMADDRRWGVEVNPYFLVGSLVDPEMTWLAGGVSRFLPEKNLELHAPLFYQDRGGDQDLILGFSLRRYFPKPGRGLFPTPEETRVDSWFKRAMETLAGLVFPGYQSPGFRPFVGITTRLYRSRSTFEDATRLGLGGTVGVRWFSSQHFYWGADVTFGRYLVGDTEAYAAVDRFILPPYDSGKIMADFTFFQFGYRF